MHDVKLGILDFGTIKPPRINSHEVINSVLMDISSYESFGYERYWLSEHYSYEFSWLSPEVLLPLMAGYSSSIKVGWAGVLLNLHSPLTVANNLRILSAIFDNRIDIGVARSGAAEEYEKVLYSNNSDWATMVEEFLIMCRGSWIDKETKEKIYVPPHSTMPPNFWYLASSARSIEMAAKNKMNFVISLKHPGSDYTKNVDTLKRYKETYYNLHGEVPITSLLVAVAVETEQRKINVLNKRLNVNGLKNLYGSADFISERLNEINKECSNDEFILYMPICERNVRLEKYQEIIKTFK